MQCECGLEGVEEYISLYSCLVDIEEGVLTAAGIARGMYDHHGKNTNFPKIKKGDLFVFACVREYLYGVSFVKEEYYKKGDLNFINEFLGIKIPIIIGFSIKNDNDPAKFNLVGKAIDNLIKSGNFSLVRIFLPE